MKTDIPKPNGEQEGNKLIAEFMGGVILDKPSKLSGLWYLGGTHEYLFPNGNHYARPDQLAYHSSWSWLMPVVEKIEATQTEFDGYFGVHICSNGCTIAGTRLNTSIENPHYAYFNDITHESKLSSTWLAVIQFIQWYNKTQHHEK